MGEADGPVVPAPAFPAALLETVIDCAPVAMMLSDESGEIVLANREAAILFGYTCAELVGGSIDRLVPVESRPGHPRLRREFVLHPSARHMGSGRDLCGLRKDGVSVPIEIALTPIDTGTGALVLSVIVDLSLRRKLEDEVRRANEELEQRVLLRTQELEQANREKEALLVDLRAQRAELERLSREDPLTGLANRRDFDHRLDTEIDRAERTGLRFAVAMLDLDFFKLVNDRFGHALGDRVLQEVADLIRGQCRGIDVIARYGGEEFALALPGSDLRSAVSVCERIRVSFETFDWSSLQVGLDLTISAGVACWRPGCTAALLMAEADENLYAAKRTGRNRVVPSA